MQIRFFFVCVQRFPWSAYKPKSLETFGACACDKVGLLPVCVIMPTWASELKMTIRGLSFCVCIVMFSGRGERRKSGVPRTPPRYIFCALHSDRRKILSDNPLLHWMFRHFLVASHNFFSQVFFNKFFFFPLPYIFFFSIIGKGERIGLYRHFQIHRPPGLT